MARIIRVNDLMKWAETHAIGRSTAHPDGWIHTDDLMNLIYEIEGQYRPTASIPSGTDTPVDPTDQWEFFGYESPHQDTPYVIWTCKRCGYQRLAGRDAPHYRCPECTGREVNTQKGNEST